MTTVNLLVKFLDGSFKTILIASISSLISGEYTRTFSQVDVLNTKSSKFSIVKFVLSTTSIKKRSSKIVLLFTSTRLKLMKSPLRNPCGCVVLIFIKLSTYD